METIFALGTGAGRAAIAVIRLSGPGVCETLSAFAGGLPEPRRAAFVTLRDPDKGEPLDQGLAIYFPGPHSATGEDYAEFQIHGGGAVIDGVLAALSRRPGLRPAEPGEFARRGFANGKLDLSQAEALADLIDAQTEAQRRQALRIAGGALRRKVEGWRTSFIEALALVEAELDFSDEADVSGVDIARLAAILDVPHAEMLAALERAPAAERMRDGFLVMILGRPNAGKSTLLNALARRDLAIVSATPGTTRDMIEAHLDLDGLPVTFVDTAGLRDAADEIERIGVDRVLERVETADLALWLSAAGEEPECVSGVEIVKVATKGDLVGAPSGWLGICAKTGAGLDALLKEVSDRAKAKMGDGGSALLIRERHRSAVAVAAAAVDSALAPDKELEFIAEDLRSAARALGRIIGAVDVEHVLDAVFSRFCIGK
ncbi:tRNA uridine-5-carboxymethylaminomethyl(34) synthesis GTPase MnmE [Methylocystis parvus]|uniref:tRNA modification GTPase MnmE n=1 Tax=Methylocystis parvus TaxID=134 RepID=A0A6B8M5Q9_9HYPH|nr:tRNA uridine-5-carboxymethylaminomethyl(34) synthesis GTPase MnmE [Methylocystis parvus]QGM97069.1 tRNA uridine-5-carboxymethylaminomethyl(34) synthesis GTPase MnmE [Methylocystis parvus]WBJ99029.1 tRNA uridine-5-carboxymethylaminomethyl(34) synthesis GTPase MnmE [Methylocystis parvus OBBP]